MKNLIRDGWNLWFGDSFDRPVSRGGNPSYEYNYNEVYGNGSRRRHHRGI